MCPTAFLNGRYLPEDQALVPANDRGFVFADGVYEVVRYYAGRPLGMAAHLDRLAFSMKALRIEWPADATPLDRVSDELIRRNELPDAYVYWQVTRGAAVRDHRFPDPPVRPTIYATVKPQPPLDRAVPPKPMSAITHPEIRWTRCGIKSIALLPNVLARQAAHEAGCDEAVFVRDDGTVTEGTARSIFIVDRGELYSYPLDGTVLGSITRQIVIDLAAQQGIAVHEQPFDVARMRAADELIAVGTTTQVRPIVTLDGKSIAEGNAGPICSRLAGAYRNHVVRQCGLAD